MVVGGLKADFAVEDLKKLSGLNLRARRFNDLKFGRGRQKNEREGMVATVPGRQASKMLSSKLRAQTTWRREVIAAEEAGATQSGEDDVLASTL